jgi:hypothetical protein
VEPELAPFKFIFKNQRFFIKVKNHPARVEPTHMHRKQWSPHGLLEECNWV